MRSPLARLRSSKVIGLLLLPLFAGNTAMTAVDAYSCSMSGGGYDPVEREAYFLISNTGSVADTYVLTAVCNGGVTIFCLRYSIFTSRHGGYALLDCHPYKKDNRAPMCVEPSSQG